MTLAYLLYRQSREYASDMMKGQKGMVEALNNLVAEMQKRPCVFKQYDKLATELLNVHMPD